MTDNLQTSILYFSLMAPRIFTIQIKLTIGMSDRTAPPTQEETPDASAFCPIVTHGTNQVTQPAQGELRLVVIDRHLVFSGRFLIK